MFLRELTTRFSAVTHGILHYRHLEGDQILGLKDRKGNFDRKNVCHTKK